MTSSALKRPLARGFTIIEVMVSLAAGVLVAMATFMMSRGATQFFQREARISSAQLALTLAMNRLTLDIQRASFLSTTNIQLDPNICKTTSGTWTAGLNLLGGINITQGTQTVQGAIQTQPLTAPDQIIIGGSMDASDVYEVQSVLVGSGGAPLLVMRDPRYEPYSYRTVAQLGPGETLATKSSTNFYPNVWPTIPVVSGRFGHIYLPESNVNWYGVIQSFTTDPVTGSIKVQFQQAPTIPVKPGSTCGLGVGDVGGGWLFSIVSRVKYSIQSLAASPEQYAQVVAPPTDANTARVSGDSGRTELVRQELDANGNPIAGAAELVAEYAVDLRFGITVASEITSNNYNPTATTYAFGDPSVYTIAADVQHAGLPQRIRAVQVRLSTRTRVPDRDTDLPAGPDGRRLRFLVDPTLASPYARVRTNYANVALPNQGGFSLW
jgi:prepilin-type N-terminal cleavage/methylation domain-containing protein